MRKIAAAIAISLTAAASSAFAETLPKDADYLFTIASSSGTFAGDTLTLEGVPLVVYFADRPTRVSGQMNLQRFLGLWDTGVDSFKDDPPNAELAIHREDGDAHAVLIISAPSVNGNDISFKVSLIDEEIPASFKHSTLFIDGADTTLTVENHSNDTGSPTVFSKP